VTSTFYGLEWLELAKISFMVMKIVIDINHVNLPCDAWC